MISTNQDPTISNQTDDSKKISILDLVIVLLEHKKFFIISMIVFSLAGITVSLISAKYYQATATILKPKGAAGLASLLGGSLPGGNLLKSMDLLGGSEESDKYISMLNSRRIAEAAIDHFNLVHHYSFDKQKKYFREDVIKAFRKSVEVLQDDYGNISIGVTDTSPTLAAAMANFMINELDSLSYSLAKESARYSRMFFAERLEIIKNDMDSASSRLTEFQIHNKYYELDQQVKSSIEALATIESQKMGLEVEKEQLIAQFGSSHQRVVEMSKTINSLDRSIKGYMDSGDGNLLIALKNSPKMAVEYGKLFRDVKIQETLYEFVVQMFEQAKFSEANNTPSIQVLEWAKEPHRKVRPKRAVICIVFFTFGFIFTAIAILLMKWFSIQKSKNTDTYDKILVILRHMQIKK